MKHVLVLLLLSTFALASAARFTHFEGLGLTVDGAIDNGHVNLRMTCTGDMSKDDGPTGTLSDIVVVSIKAPQKDTSRPGYDPVYYHAEMTATCTSLSK